MLTFFISGQATQSKRDLFFLDKIRTTMHLEGQQIGE